MSRVPGVPNNRVELVLPLPPTMNHYWRHVGRKVLISAEGRAYKNSCATAAAMQQSEALVGDVAVEGVVYMARAGCDLDNRIKPLLDAIKGICYADDAQVARIVLDRRIDRGNPRVEITVSPIGYRFTGMKQSAVA